MSSAQSQYAETSDLPSSLTVLLVEPQRFLSGILRHALISAGVLTDNILEVRDAAGALTLMKSRIPDVILTELNLPDADGGFLASKVREWGIRVPIMAVTSEATEYKVREAVGAGVNDVLVKPVSQLLVSKRIARQLSAHPPVPFAHEHQAPAHLSGFSL